VQSRVVSLLKRIFQKRDRFVVGGIADQRLRMV